MKKKHLTVIFIIGLTLNILIGVITASPVRALTPKDISAEKISGYIFRVNNYSFYKYNAGNSIGFTVENSHYVNDGEEVYINGIAFLDKNRHVMKSYYSDKKDSAYYYEKTFDRNFFPKNSCSIEYHICTNATDLGWIHPQDLHVTPTIK